MSTAAELLSGIGEAVDELGYRVVLVEPDRVVIEPNVPESARYSVTIEGSPRFYGRTLVDGPGIRKVLRNLNPVECKCGCCK